MSTPHPRRLIRPLVLLLALALSGCGGGGGDDAASSPPPASGGGSAPPVSDLALYQYYVSTDTAGQHEGAAAIGAGEVGEFPDVTQTDGRAEGGGENAKAAGKSIPFCGKGLLAHSILNSTVNVRIWHILSHDLMGRQIFPLI